MLTVHFEDHGQDFLEWDIQNGEVVGCRPFQEWLWNGTKIHNTDIQAGDILQITTSDGVERTLKYPVERVEEKEDAEANPATMVKGDSREWGI